MKQPPGLWLLLSAGVLWFSLQDVDGIRATALIFGKSTTTTTTTDKNLESASDVAAASAAGEEVETETSTEATSNVTKPTLTGIPQIDYIWDPNLPKELNGYNLSEYPFYERVPEDIDFKCDGLHDGFYASVPHKCQVYHHCLFGTRYDFLCANYTAFDQKTFICQFVSEVDCVNSKKYWHRNDALYEAASTTTIKPPVILYTPPPQPPPDSAGSSPLIPRRSVNRRRPSRRRRPQYEYYDYDDEYEDDDYYEERRPERRRNKRPRPRPRPVYDDEYEEYEDDRYERRGGNRREEDRRKGYDRRPAEDRRPNERRRNKDRRKYEDSSKVDYEEEVEEVKRPNERRTHKRRPAEDIDVDDDDRRRSRPKGSRRPIEDDYDEDELPPNGKTGSVEPITDKPIIKPISGSSIYGRPRTAPKIKPPVPKNEAEKYAYKASDKPKVGTVDDAEDEEYYDDEYEEELSSKNSKHGNRKSDASESRRYSTRHQEESDGKRKQNRPKPSSTTPPKVDDYDDDDVEEEVVVRRPHKSRPKYGTLSRTRSNNNKKQPTTEEYEEEYEVESTSERKPIAKLDRNKFKPSTSTTSTTTSTTTTTTTTTPPPTTTKASTTTYKEFRERPDSIVRIVKRPFLPSRGGSPYTSRGLQPVGSKATDKKPDIKDEELTSEEELEDSKETDQIKPTFKPSPVIYKTPVRQKFVSISQEEPATNRPQIGIRPSFKPNKDFSGPRTTQKPKLPNQDPLDIKEDEYDVTLNDALNPTLPNLPIRSFPTGFSNGYNGGNYDRQRYIVEPVVSSAASDYVYQQTKPVRQTYETGPQTFSTSQDHFVNSNTNFKGQFSTISGQSYRPRVTQAYYTGY